MKAELELIAPFEVAKLISLNGLEIASLIS